MKAYRLLSAAWVFLATIYLGYYLAGNRTFIAPHDLIGYLSILVNCTIFLFILAIFIFFIIDIIRPLNSRQPGDRNALFFLNLQAFAWVILKISNEVWPIIWPNIPEADRIFFGFSIWIVVLSLFAAICFDPEIKKWRLGIVT